MAAPTVVYIASGQINGTVNLPASTITSPAVGDLAVIVQNGTKIGSAFEANLSYQAGGDAGYTSIGACVSGTASAGKTNIWAKILVSGDFSGSNFKQLSITNTSHWATYRCELYIFRHANGWEAVNTQTAYTDIAGFTANSDQSVTASSARANVAVLGFANSTSVATLAIKWNSDANHQCYCDESSWTISGEQLERTDGGGGTPVTFTNGSPTVTTNAAALSSDVGGANFGSNHGIPDQSLIISAVAGTSYTFSDNATSSGTGTVSIARHYGTNNGVAQSDYHAFAAGTGPTTFQLSGGATSAHAVVIGFFQTAVTTITGTAAFSGGGTLSSSGIPTVLGTASFVGSGTLHVDGIPTVNGTATFGGGGTLHADQAGVTTIQGTAAFTGGGTLAARQAIIGVAVFTGNGTLSATGTRTTFSSAVAFTGGGILHANQQTLTLGLGGAGNWAEGSISLFGGDTLTGIAAFSGGGVLAATGHKLAHNFGEAHFTGGGTLHATGAPVRSGTCTFSGGGTLTIFQHRTHIKHKGHFNLNSQGSFNMKTYATMEL